MSLDLNGRKAQLLKMEKDLSKELNASENSAIDAAPFDEARDTTDDAVADEERDTNYAQGDRAYEELLEVRAALQRIDAGTYGKCEVCGKTINPERLDAVPATRYCIEDARAREPKVTPATL